MNRPDDAPVDQHGPQGDHLFCHKEGSRVCSADCVAYLVVRPEGKEYQGAPWALCQELVSAHRTAKHLTIIAQHVVRKEEG